MTDDVIVFKKTLRSVLKNKGIKPADIAGTLNIYKSTLHNWMNIEKKNVPRIDEAFKLSQHLGVTLDYLASGDKKCNLSKIEKEMVSLIKTVDEGTKSEILGVVRKEVRAYHEEQKGGTGSETQAG